MYAVVGHFVDSKGTPYKIDSEIQVELFETREGAEGSIDWYPDGVIVEVAT
jgi:hypothetical protein